MEDEIIALLKNSKLRAEISQVMTEVYEWFGTWYDNPPEHMKTLAEEDLYDEAWEDAKLAGEFERLYEVFQKYVFNKIPVPHRIHLDEVLEIFFDMAKPDARGSLCRDCKYPYSAYTSFVNYVNNRVLLHRYSAPFPVCTILAGETTSVGWSWATQTMILKRGDQDSVSNENEQPEIYEGTLWGNDAGVCLNLVGKGRFESRYKDSFHVMTQIAGRMSETVWRELSEELQRILPSMWRSVKMLGKTYRMWERGPSIVDYNPANTDESKIPVISEADFESGRLFVRKCIDAYFSTPTKEDSFDRRIRNAVHLLIASDAQSNGAVGLALSVTAIEALLGQQGKDKKGKDIKTTQRLAENVAALLEEPELPLHQKAMKFVKDLYNKRSRVLHGEEIDKCADVRLEGRHLAAAVLHGMITCRDSWSRFGCDPQTLDEFLAGLHEKQGQPDGLWESNVRELWR